MRIDFVARESHYVDHLAPVYLALPEEYRGAFYTRIGLLAYASQRGIMGRAHRSQRRLIRLLARRATAVVTTGYNDLRLSSRSGRPQIYNNHGAGFTYGTNHPSYAGSRRGRGRVVLFLTPSESTAAVERRALPHVPAVAVGCPKLDAWHRLLLDPRQEPSGADPPVVAVSFHFNARRIPETRWALPHYRHALADLAANFAIIGHAHPRARGRLRRVYDEFGIRYVPDFDSVLAEADVYVCDTSSTLYEFASLDRPVVVLNAPWYRRDRNFTGNPRFWQYADVGVQCDHPRALVDAVHRAVEDAPAQREARRRAVAAVYAVRDGTAAARAASAIMARVAELTPPKGGTGDRGA
ncbi:MAG: CDP-glycerol glycerophosphotransferase family protein [Acidobacteria bacterium]|nr:CDP-glycerol glycerophosphotransferase family protein [Acidobacteriota bacterium]